MAIAFSCPRFSIPQIDVATAPPGSATATTVIWGTNINAETLQQKVQDFLLTFREEGAVAMDEEEDSEAPPAAGEKYVQLIHRAHDEGIDVVNLDTSDVRRADATLYKWLVAYPHEVLPIFDLQVGLGSR